VGSDQNSPIFVSVILKKNSRARNFVTRIRRQNFNTYISVLFAKQNYSYQNKKDEIEWTCNMHKVDVKCTHVFMKKLCKEV
jgi:hypothetical protein